MTKSKSFLSKHRILNCLISSRRNRQDRQGSERPEWADHPLPWIRAWEGKDR